MTIGTTDQIAIYVVASIVALVLAGKIKSVLADLVWNIKFMFCKDVAAERKVIITRNRK